jgi:hypothetical protein
MSCLSAINTGSLYVVTTLKVDVRFVLVSLRTAGVTLRRPLPPALLQLKHDPVERGLHSLTAAYLMGVVHALPEARQRQFSGQWGRSQANAREAFRQFLLHRRLVKHLQG